MFWYRRDHCYVAHQIIVDGMKLLATYLLKGTIFKL